jgi:hypothetical protein
MGDADEALAARLAAHPLWNAKLRRWAKARIGGSPRAKKNAEDVLRQLNRHDALRTSVAKAQARWDAGDNEDPDA